MAEGPEGSNKDLSFVPLPARSISATLDCALRLSGVTACAYTSSVIFALACRNSSCTTLTSSPVAFSKVEKVRRKVCQPIRFAIFARVAAGRMDRFRIASGL